MIGKIWRKDISKRNGDIYSLNMMFESDKTDLATLFDWSK